MQQAALDLGWSDGGGNGTTRWIENSGPSFGFSPRVRPADPLRLMIPVTSSAIRCDGCWDHAVVACRSYSIMGVGKRMQKCHWPRNCPESDSGCDILSRGDVIHITNMRLHIRQGANNNGS